MSMNKRDFLKIAGMAALGAGWSVKTAGASSGHGQEAVDTSGTRWAMVIDLTNEEVNWKDCIKACHTQHNVPDLVTNQNKSINNPKHEIKWMWLEPYANSFAVEGSEERFLADHIREMEMPVLCNQCDHPPCVRACPTQATFQRPDGIVAMDYHRCIGCRFCMAACPFGSRSFNLKDPRLAFQDAANKDSADQGFKVPNPHFPTRMKGVVEKCNFCAELLAVGKKPRCVEESKGAIHFGDLNGHKKGYDDVAKILSERFTLRRKPELGTLPMVYYIVR